MTTTRASVLLFSKDLERLAAFYGPALSLEPRPTGEPGLLELQSGGKVVLSLHALPADIAAQISLEDPPRARRDTALKPCFWVDEVESVRAAVLAHGGRAQETWEWEGRRHCDCVDPEGNVFQLVSA